MSSYELAARTAVSPTRIREYEQAEVDGSVRLGALDRVAHGLNCSLFYVLVPDEPLQLMVRRQARLKAAAAIAANWDDQGIDDPPLLKLAMRAQLQSMTAHLMDRRGLWR